MCNVTAFCTKYFLSFYHTLVCWLSCVVFWAKKGIYCAILSSALPTLLLWLWLPFFHVGVAAIVKRYRRNVWMFLACCPSSLSLLLLLFLSFMCVSICGKMYAYVFLMLRSNDINCQHNFSNFFCILIFPFLFVKYYNLYYTGFCLYVHFHFLSVCQI